MTIRDAMQSASIRLLGRKPSEFFSSTDQFEQELADLVNEAAKDITKDHAWSALTTLNTIPGDGVTTAFPLPADYDRMPVDVDIHSQTWNTWRFARTRDLDQYLDFTTGMGIMSPGIWVMLGGKINFYPAIGTGEQAKFYYQSKNYAVDKDGIPKAAFSRDDDTFVLSERLLTLELIWRWRSQKRLEYSEDMANAQKARSEEIGADKGARILAIGPDRFPADVRTAYPRPLG